MKLVLSQCWNFGVTVTLSSPCKQVLLRPRRTMPIKVLGCLQGDGSEQKPWYLPASPLPAPAPCSRAGGGGLASRWPGAGGGTGRCGSTG